MRIKYLLESLQDIVDTVWSETCFELLNKKDQERLEQLSDDASDSGRMQDLLAFMAKLPMITIPMLRAYPGRGVEITCPLFATSEDCKSKDLETVLNKADLVHELIVPTVQDALPVFMIVHRLIEGTTLRVYDPSKSKGTYVTRHPADKIIAKHMSDTAPDILALQDELLDAGLL